jgi:hypothetical protein
MVAKFWLDPMALEQARGFNRTELNGIGKLFSGASASITGGME